MVAIFGVGNLVESMEAAAIQVNSSRKFPETLNLMKGGLESRCESSCGLDLKGSARSYQYYPRGPRTPIIGFLGPNTIDSIVGPWTLRVKAIFRRRRGVLGNSGHMPGLHKDYRGPATPTSFFRGYSPP